MAHMICCATDWTLDLFMADMEKARPLPLKRGVHLPSSASCEECFCTWLKTSAKFFLEEWLEEYGCKYAHCTYVGDAWLDSISDCLSDWYKDTYNQRPHFHKEYFAMACGLPTNADTLIRWNNSFQRDMESAKRFREVDSEQDSEFRLELGNRIKPLFFRCFFNIIILKTFSKKFFKNY